MGSKAVFTRQNHFYIMLKCIERGAKTFSFLLKIMYPKVKWILTLDLIDDLNSISDGDWFNNNNNNNNNNNEKREREVSSTQHLVVRILYIRKY